MSEVNVRFNLFVTATIEHEYENCSTPTNAEIVITQELIDKILKMHKAMTSVDSYGIISFDNSPLWFIEDEPDNPGNSNKTAFIGEVEPISLRVFEECLFWEGDIINEGYKEASVETNYIDICDVIEINEILNSPKEDLPLWVEKVKSEKGKEVLEWRLQNE